MDVEVRKTSTTPPNPTRKNTLRVFLALFIAFGTLSIPFFSLQNYAEILKSTPAAPENPKAECAVVLTGAHGRVREGITLLSQDAISKLIISGVHQRSTLADMFPEIIYYPEINLENVILERRSTTTAANAQQSLPIVEALNCHTVLLVTHDYHMHRALKTFTQAFPAEIQLIPYPIVSGRLVSHRAHGPDPRFWGAVFDEWYKFLFYSVFVF